jgi:hypothetical protein
VAHANPDRVAVPLGHDDERDRDQDRAAVERRQRFDTVVSRSLRSMWASARGPMPPKAVNAARVASSAASAA